VSVGFVGDGVWQPGKNPTGGGGGVMVGRGDRGLPIRADFGGKHLPTSRTGDVRVSPDGVDIVEVTS